MSAYLLDVNVLIALVDPDHARHDAAHSWFQSEGGRAWATCPHTENGLLRIVGHPRYPGSPGTPAAVARLLASLRAHHGHRFWPDHISLLDRTQVDSERLLSSGQVTDSYLLAVAMAHGGRLATFDRRLAPDAIMNGRDGLVLLE